MVKFIPSRSVYEDRSMILLLQYVLMYVFNSLERVEESRISQIHTATVLDDATGKADIKFSKVLKQVLPFCQYTQSLGCRSGKATKRNFLGNCA